MGSTVQYSTVQYSIVQYCTVLYCTVLYCNVLYSTVLYCTVLYRTVLYYTVLYCTRRNEKICRQRTNKQTDISKTESTLILSGSSTDTRGSWPIIFMKIYFYTRRIC